MADNVNTMEKRLNATIRQLREDVQTARQEQFEEDCKVVESFVEVDTGKYPPGHVLNLSDENIAYTKVLVALRRAREERND